MFERFRFLSLFVITVASSFPTNSQALPGSQTMESFQRYEDASFETLVEDLRVKVQGGFLVHQRRYVHGHWRFNQDWDPILKRSPTVSFFSSEPSSTSQCPYGWTKINGVVTCHSDGASPYKNQVTDGFQLGSRMFPFQSGASVLSSPDSEGPRIARESGTGERIEETSSTTASWYHIDGDVNKYATIASIPNKYFLMEKLDSNGVKQSFEYDEKGNLLQVRDHFGVVALSFTYNENDLLISVKSRSGREVRYEWDSNSLLSRVTDTLQGVWTYSYDKSGRLIAILDPLLRTTSIAQLVGANPLGHPIPVSGNTLEILRNNGASKIRYEQSYPQSGLERFYHVKSTNDVGYVRSELRNSKGKIVRIEEQGETTYREVSRVASKVVSEDELGRATVTYLDPSTELVTSVVHPDGAKETYEYQPGSNRIIKEVDALGRTKLYTYDAKGNGIKMLVAAGTAAAKTLTYAYDLYGNIIKVTEAGNPTEGVADVSTTFTYDTFGNPTKVTNAQGKVLNFTFNELGSPASITDALGRKWEMTYDTAGNLLTKKDPASAIYSYSYDAIGRLLQSTNALGKVTTYSFDGNDYLREIRNPQGAVSKFIRRSDGIVREVWDEVNRKLFSIESDSLGRTLGVTDAGGNLTAYEYDKKFSGGGLFLPSKVTTQKYNSTYRYDLRNRPRFENLNLTEEETLTSETRYDKAGRIIANKFPNGSLTSIAYDERGNIKSVTDTAGKTTTFTYDIRDNLIELIDANDNSTVFAYDSLDRLILETTPQGRVTKYSYDALDRVVSITDAKNQKITYEYSLQGLVSKEKHFATATSTVPLKTIVYTYDIEGRLTGWNDGSFAASCSYDDLGRNTGCTTSYGAFEKIFGYEYNLDGRKKSFVGPDNEKTLFAYDAAGRLSSVTNSAGVGVSYSAFVNNAPTKVTYANGLVRSITYSPLTETTSIRTENSNEDAVFELTQGYDKVRNVVTKGIDGVTTEYVYDNAMRLASAKQNGIENESFSYDSLGNRVTEGSIALTYSADNELLSFGNVGFTYDSNGNLSSKTELGVTTLFKYDVLNRLTQVESPAGSIVARYGYDPFSRRLWKEVGGYKTWFFYSHEGLVAEFSALGEQTRSYGWKPDSVWSTDPVFVAGANKQWNYFENDVLGTPQKVFDSTGKLVWSATYNAFGKALVIKNEFPVNLRLAGQYYDQETGLHYNWHRYYDARMGRYVTRDPLGITASSDLNSYSYVANSPLGVGDPSGLFAQVAWGALSGFAFEAVQQSLQHGSNFGCWDWGQVGFGTAEGAVEGLVLGGFGKAIKAVKALKTQRAAKIAGNKLEVVYHYTTRNAAKSIMQEGVLKGSPTPGLWRPWRTGDVYLSTKAKLTILDRLFYGLPKNKTEAIIKLNMPANKLGRAPNGIRIHRGDIDIGEYGGSLGP